MKTATTMSKKQSEYRYSQISSLTGIHAEKERLRRKIRKQEKKLETDWEQIAKKWRIVSRITGMGSKLFSSFSLLGGAELGYKIISYFFPEKKQKTNPPPASCPTEGETIPIKEE